MEYNKEKIPFSVSTATSVLLLAFDYTDRFNDAKEFLKKKGRHTITGISYRTLNHWEKIGLIDNERPDGKGWRKYSIIDMVWLHIIISLRNFGFPHKKILKVRQKLMNNKKPNERMSDSRVLLFYTILAYCKRKPVTLLVLQEKSDVQFVTDNELTFDHYFNNLGNHISIPLNPFIQKLSGKDLSPKFPLSAKITEKEATLLGVIRYGNYESIKIKLKGKEIDLLENTELINNSERITDILKSKDFLNIELKQRDGKIVCLKKTDLIKP